MARPAKAIDTATGARTKEDVQTRQATERKLRGENVNVGCPDYLTKSQRKIFEKIKSLLKEAGLLGKVDGYILANAAVSIDRVAEIDEMCNNDTSRTSYTAKDIVNARKTYMNDFFRCCNELCLSPQARAKLGVAAAEARKKTTDPLMAALADDDDD